MTEQQKDVLWACYFCGLGGWMLSGFSPTGALAGVVVALLVTKYW